MLCKTVPLRQGHLAQREAERNSFQPISAHAKPISILFIVATQASGCPQKQSKERRVERCGRRERERAALTTMFEESRSLFSFEMNFMRLR